jgi:hypothetical protein
MDLNTLAITASLLLLIYHQVTTWFPMFPWNDIDSFSRKDIVVEALFNGLVMGLGVLSLVKGDTGFYKYYPLAYYPFLLTGEFFQWWLPYFSTSFAKSKYNFDYEPRYSRTFKFLPHQSGKRTPDANHMILHFLTLVTVILVYLNFFS